jgi:ATP-dependent Clp protease protease subunit
MRNKIDGPWRVFEGNAKYQEPFWTWQNVLEGEDPEMELDGYISEWSWFEDDITPKKFKEDLISHGQGGPITIRLNSYGGDVIAASMISSIMRDYPGKITVVIDGIAASAATVVAVAAKEIKIQDTAYFMVHDPSVVFFMASLNIEALTRLADSLGAIKEGIINAYETRTGLSRPRLSKLMTDETWMDAHRALDLGFVDEILKNPYSELFRLPIDNAAVVNGLRNYSNVPAAVLQALTHGDQPATMASSGSMLTDEQQREAQILSDQVKIILKEEKNNDRS